MAPADGGHMFAKRHPEQRLGGGEGVKGQSRLAGARSAALEAVALTSAQSSSRAPVCDVPRLGSLSFIHGVRREVL